MQRVKHSWKLFWAGLAATAAFWLPLALGATYTVFLVPFVNPDGSPDNAPNRGAGFFLFVLPVLFVVSLAVSYIGGLFLKASGLISLRAVAYATLIVSFLVALFFAQAQPPNPTFVDYLVAFGLLVLFFGTLLLVSGTVWWLIARNEV